MTFHGTQRAERVCIVAKVTYDKYRTVLFLTLRSLFIYARQKNVTPDRTIQIVNRGTIQVVQGNVVLILTFIFCLKLHPESIFIKAFFLTCIVGTIVVVAKNEVILHHGYRISGNQRFYERNPVHIEGCFTHFHLSKGMQMPYLIAGINNPTSIKIFASITFLEIDGITTILLLFENPLGTIIEISSIGPVIIVGCYPSITPTNSSQHTVWVAPDTITFTSFNLTGIGFVEKEVITLTRFLKFNKIGISDLLQISHGETTISEIRDIQHLVVRNKDNTTFTSYSLFKSHLITQRKLKDVFCTRHL